ncbi:Golgin candidate 6 [Zea mays]|uniref:Golgin candidate 6 n=1 Tax=Zea mays TaxID=4577 RepID=A0A1D6NNB2_MAIZE|nr:Golgin candidate 6 [Zea mays]
MLAEELLRTGGGMTTDTSQKPSSGRERVQIEALRQELEGAKRQIGALKSEKSQIEAEANNQRNLSVKLESDLKSLSEAYNSIEQPTTAWMPRVLAMTLPFQMMTMKDEDDEE